MCRAVEVSEKQILPSGPFRLSATSSQLSLMVGTRTPDVISSDLPGVWISALNLPIEDVFNLGSDK